MSPTQDEPVEGLVSPEAPVETPPPPEPPPPILPGDAEGRQAGNPNDPIELPKYLTEQRPATYQVIAGPVPPTEEEMLKIMNLKPAVPPAAFPASAPALNTPAPHSPVPQSPVAMPASFAGGALVNEATGMVAVEQAAPSTMMTAQTLSEAEYGRQVVARHRANAERGRAIAAQAAARRLETNAKPDAEDLNYVTPKS